MGRTMLLRQATVILVLCCTIVREEVIFLAADFLASPVAEVNSESGGSSELPLTLECEFTVADYDTDDPKESVCVSEPFEPPYLPCDVLADNGQPLPRLIESLYHLKRLRI